MTRPAGFQRVELVTVEMISLVDMIDVSFVRVHTMAAAFQ